MPAEEADLDAGSLLLVAHQAHHTIGLQGFDDVAHCGAAHKEHLKPVALTSLDHSLIERSGEAAGDGGDGVSEGASE